VPGLSRRGWATLLFSLGYLASEAPSQQRGAVDGHRRAGARMRYLVTGAAGFIGSHLCEQLIDNGHTVVGVDSFTGYYARRLKEAHVAALAGNDAWRFVEADLADMDLTALLDGVDGVFHLAGQPGVRLSWGEGFASYVQDNIWATQRVFDAVSTHPTPIPIVCASSSSVYGETTRARIHETDPVTPVSPYGLTKLACEHLARMYRDEHGILVTCLRYFTVYGPRQRPDMAFSRFIEAARAGRPVQVLGSGLQTRDFTYVSDVVDATIRALGAPELVYNIGGGEPASVMEVLTHLGDLVGRPLPVEHRERARGDVTHTWADTERARGDLGWSPGVGLVEGLTAQFAGQAWRRELTG